MSTSTGPAYLTRDLQLARARAEAVVALLAGSPNPAHIEEHERSPDLIIAQIPFNERFDLRELGPLLLRVQRGRVDEESRFQPTDTQHYPLRTTDEVLERVGMEQEIAAAERDADLRDLRFALYDVDARAVVSMPTAPSTTTD